MDAYVEGLPIPFASNVFTREASVYLAGGFVLCSTAERSSQWISSFTSTSGRIVSLSASFASGSSLPSTYARIYPGKRMTFPRERNRAFWLEMNSVVCFIFAGTI